MTSQQTETELHDAVTASGAVFGPGSDIPLHFGDAESELQNLLNGAGVIDRSASALISHTGPDALDLLHRLTTNDLLSLKPGRAAATVITSDKGRVVDVVTVAFKAADDLMLLSDSPDAAPAMEFVDRYTIIEDAELADLSATTARIDLIGPDAPSIVKSLTSGGIENGATITAKVSDFDVDMVRLDWPQLPHIALVVDRSNAASLWRSLVEAGAVPAGEEAFHTARVMSGVPFPGAELSDRVNPLEAGLESLVSFTKGCYIGQEVIARLDSYDKLQRRLMFLNSNQPFEAGAELTSIDGKRAGEVTSVAPLVREGQTISLGLVRKGNWDQGTVLRCGDADVTIAETRSAD